MDTCLRVQYPGVLGSTIEALLARNFVSGLWGLSRRGATVAAEFVLVSVLLMTGNDCNHFSGQAKQKRPRQMGDTAPTNEGGISHAAPARARHWLSNDARHALGTRTVSRLPVGAHYATHSTANNVSYDKSAGGAEQPQPAASRPHVWRSRRRPQRRRGAHPLLTGRRIVVRVHHLLWPFHAILLLVYSS